MKAWQFTAVLATALVSVANAQSTAERPWQTDAVFRAPESVLHDADQDRLYVSNVDGAPNDKDGNGFISLLGMDGNIEQLEWVTGLNAPKGMARIGDTTEEIKNIIEQLQNKSQDAVAAMEAGSNQVLITVNRLNREAHHCRPYPNQLQPSGI